MSDVLIAFLLCFDGIMGRHATRLVQHDALDKKEATLITDLGLYVGSVFKILQGEATKYSSVELNVAEVCAKASVIKDEEMSRLLSFELGN